MRDIPVGNGCLLVNFDDLYRIRDIYFPHVGQENQTNGYPSRLGLWVDGKFSWTESSAWQRSLRYIRETLVTDVKLTCEQLEVEIIANDTVASHENVFLRRLHVTNKASNAREFRLFFHHDLRLYENKVGDTAFYHPEINSIVHYQKNRYFLINTEPAFSSFVTGRKDFQGQEGTWRDAEDGELNGGTITEGSVDSTIGITFTVEAGASYELFCWIAAGTSLDETVKLNDLVRKSGAVRYFDFTENYWRVWVNKNDPDLSELPDNIAKLHKRSLLIVRTQTDNHGAILAANDWDVTERATDHYSYLWPRDGAFVANALDLAGFSHLTRKFFRLCGNIVHPNGYFLQKYNADGTVGSGWHTSWDRYAKKPQVPIQEDETGLVLWALWEHYDRFRDIEFAQDLYKKMVIRCADFMADFIHPELGLPNPSWNLWEDRRGIHTFTCATVVAGLRAASNFATLFAENERAERYALSANNITAAMERHLYRPDLGRFLRSLQFHGDEHYEADAIIDASLFGTWYFGCFDPRSEMVMNTMRAVEEKLTVKGGGIARFENDGYMRASDQYTGNAWFICTLWLADHYIAIANNKEELEPAMKLIQWAAENAQPSGVMAEQIEPLTSKSSSVSPLTWSHSTFVATTLGYLEKLRSF